MPISVLLGVQDVRAVTGGAHPRRPSPRRHCSAPSRCSRRRRPLIAGSGEPIFGAGILRAGQHVVEPAQPGHLVGVQLRSLHQAAGGAQRREARVRALGVGQLHDRVGDVRGRRWRRPAIRAPRSGWRALRTRMPERAARRPGRNEPTGHVVTTVASTAPGANGAVSRENPAGSRRYRFPLEHAFVNGLRLRTTERPRRRRPV